MSVILGFNAFHADSAACLVVDGHLVGAVAEERLGERRKHSPAFPALGTGADRCRAGSESLRPVFKSYRLMMRSRASLLWRRRPPYASALRVLRCPLWP